MVGTWEHLLSPGPCTLPLRYSSSLPHVYAASGKGFGELLRKQKKTDGKENATSLQGKGFGQKFSNARKISKMISSDSDGVDDEKTACPCGGGENKLSYVDCCLPYHQGNKIAPDGLTLLKTRFSAYVRGIIGYVVDTTHPENPDFGDDLVANVEATCNQLIFYKLHIDGHEAINENESTVAFRAIYGPRKGGQRNRKVLQERSYFVREGEKWLFRDGVEVSHVTQEEWMLSSKDK